MAYETILYEVAAEIATVTLNRPAKLNAWTPAMGREIVDAMRQADDDRDVRVIILTGAGRAFCAGADLRGFADNIKARDEDSSGNSERRGGMVEFPSLMRTLSKPSIVAINGIALGIGATMALPCDIRIMADTAKIGTSLRDSCLGKLGARDMLDPGLAVWQPHSLEPAVNARRGADQENGQ